MKEGVEVTAWQRRRARLFSLVVLSGFLAALAYGGKHAYEAATDSFVAPIILSPDSDLVLTNKLHASQLSAERAKTAAEIEATDEDLAAGEKAVSRLESLQRLGNEPRPWLSSQNARLVAASAAELGMLKKQTAVLEAMIERQHDLVRTTGANVEANLVSTTDYAREGQVLDHLELQLAESRRAEVRGTLEMQQASAVYHSLSGRGPAMPELILREEQTVRIELEVQKLASEVRAKRIVRRVLEEKLAKIDVLESQLRSRPISRAAERSLDVAFVPYTQLGGVLGGNTVYQCVWGLFSCKPVGVVAEIVPGEVVLPDPWGNQARGQFAILELYDHDSAKARMLRVRSAPGRSARSAEGGGVSSR